MSDTQNTIKNLIEMLSQLKKVIWAYSNSEIMFQEYIRNNDVVHWECTTKKLATLEVNPITRINEILKENSYDFIQLIEEIEPHLDYIDVQEKYECSDHLFYATCNVVLSIVNQYNFNKKDFYFVVSFDSKALVNSRNINRFFQSLDISRKNKLMFDFISSSKKLNDKVNLLDDFEKFKETADSRIVSNFYDYASDYNRSVLKGLEPLILDLETVIKLLSEFVD